MKKNQLINLGLTAAVITTTLSGCSLSQMVKMAKDQQLTVNPSPLELHGDSVSFEMSAVLPVKMLKKNKTYTVEPFYAYKDQKQSLGTVSFNSKDFPRAKTEQPRVSKRFAFAFKPNEHERGDLLVVGTAANINGRKKKTPEFNTGTKGVILTSKLVQDLYTPAIAAHGYNAGEELEPTTVQFYFEQGSSKLRTTETKSTRGRFLDNFIASKNPTKTVVITGLHSPEGREVRNTALSEERAKAIEQYYRKMMADFDYSSKVKAKKGKGKGKATAAPAAPAMNIEFVTKSIVQDWKIFKDTLAVFQGLTAEQKAEINATIDNSKGTFQETELELQKLSSYEVVFNQVYPKLRSAETEILTIAPKKDVATIQSLAKAIASGTENPKRLSDKELAFSATLTPVLEEKEAIYRAATKKNDSWQSHNNLGAVYIMMATRTVGKDRVNYAERAITQLSISKNKLNTAEANTNLAIAYLLKGENNNAMLSLAAAGSAEASEEATKVIRSLNGGLFIKAGKYAQAIENLSKGISDPVVSFNKGLAFVLAKNFDAGITSFQEALAAKPDYAIAQYGLAIAYARKKDETNMARALSQACKLDANLKSKAVTDLEFLSYFEKDSFKNAVR